MSPRGPARRDKRPAAPDVPGLPARREAADLVAAILDGRATLDDAPVSQLSGADHGLARAIAVTTFRRFGTIRGALDSRLAKGAPTDPFVVALLATGAAQILFLDVPDHAAVDLSVRLAEAGKRTAHLTGLVNAVLRRLARERDEILAAAPPILDLPRWLAERWDGFYGAERVDAIAAAHRAGAALDLTCRSDAAGWAERLGGALLPTGSVRVSERTPVHELPGYHEGAWWVQDAAAAIPARLLDAKAGERVLDLCAAPGGKTAQLAATGARVTAIDRSAPRLERLRANLARLGLEAEILCQDGLVHKARPYDAVLLDAPCTATGTIRRHPDVAWIRGPADIATLAALQTRLLDRAAELVRPGGRLVYCVCSLEPEEGELQAEAFLGRRRDFARRMLEPGEAGIDPAFISPAGDLRTAPDLWPPTGPDERAGLDGFFAICLVRKV